MRFMMIKEYPIEEIEFLKGKYHITSGPWEEEIIYEVEENLRERLKVLEEAGLIKEIKTGIREIESVEDIMALTSRVEILQGGSIYMRAIVADHAFTFTENELFTPFALQKQLLRLRKIVFVNKKGWHQVLQYWFNIGEEIKEVSPEEEVVERVLNYLGNCRVYTEKGRTNVPRTLYYNELESDRVYCSVDHLVEHLGSDNRRKLRSHLSDYIVANSVQFWIYNERRRYWAFSIERCGINLDRQLYQEEEEGGAEERRESEAESEE